MVFRVFYVVRRALWGDLGGFSSRCIAKKIAQLSEAQSSKLIYLISSTAAATGSQIQQADAVKVKKIQRMNHISNWELNLTS